MGFTRVCRVFSVLLVGSGKFGSVGVITEFLLLFIVVVLFSSSVG